MLHRLQIQPGPAEKDRSLLIKFDSLLYATFEFHLIIPSETIKDFPPNQRRRTFPNNCDAKHFRHSWSPA